MLDKRAALPRDEMTATMIGAAFDECIKVMNQRGLSSDAVTSEFLYTGVTGLWDREDREGLRAKAYVAVSACVDGLFDSIDRPREPSPFPEMDDPTFHARAHALIAKEERSFQDWLATDSFDALIDEALAAAKAAFGEIKSGPDPKGFDTIAMIDIGDRRAKPLVQALQSRRMGRLDAVTFTYDLDVGDLIRPRSRPHYAAACAAVEAFAMVVSRPGFVFTIYRGDEATILVA